MTHAVGALSTFAGKIDLIEHIVSWDQITKATLGAPVATLTGLVAWCGKGHGFYITVRVETKVAKVGLGVQ